MRSEPLQTGPEQASGGQWGYVKSIERGKVGLGDDVLPGFAVSVATLFEE